MIGTPHMSRLTRDCKAAYDRKEAGRGWYWKAACDWKGFPGTFY